jgi:hypothetical protein
MAVRKMHQTTVRFGPDLWEALEDECAHLGVSVAQFLREAALTRLVYAAGRRGDDEFELALDLVAAKAPASEAPRDPLPPPIELDRFATTAQSAEITAQRASRESLESAALHAQGRLARQRARELRALVARHRRA